MADLVASHTRQHGLPVADGVAAFQGLCGRFLAVCAQAINDPGERAGVRRTRSCYARPHEKGPAFAAENVGVRIAVVSDIHGNDIALEAVLKHASGTGYDRLFDLGDTVSGPLRPSETFERMRSLDAVAIAGNHERQLLTLPPERLNASDAFTLDRLGADRVNTFRGRKPTCRVDDILLVHGSPSSDLDYLLEDVTSGKPAIRDPAEVATMMSSAGEGLSLILCGHTHIQRAMQIESGILVVNPGSVGLPAYDEPDSAPPHRMEAGTPHARYAMLSRMPGGWSVDFHLVAYDWMSAAEDARRSGRHDWAHAILTGFAAP